MLRLERAIYLSLTVLAVVRKSIGAFVAALALIMLSYIVIYHAIGFFEMIAA